MLARYDPDSMKVGIDSTTGWLAPRFMTEGFCRIGPASEVFWALPGGRAEMGEVAEHTIRREMREEMSTDVVVIRLLWLVENFFDMTASAIARSPFIS
jgi:8-oxo-dGTP pyrophosphatase MutT (NUDIX family)